MLALPNAQSGGSPTADPSTISDDEAMHQMTRSAVSLPRDGGLASFGGAVEWLNSYPLTPDGLCGKVVLVDLLTYTCINCLRTLPYVRAWSAKYQDKGLIVI